MKTSSPPRPRDDWAYFRYALVAPLLVNPPKRGELQQRLRELASHTYIHPVSGAPVSFSVSTLERWFYLARAAQDPIVALIRSLRKDAGQMKMSPLARKYLCQLHQNHPTWSKMLLHENLLALLKKEASEKLPSYSTTRRYLLVHGMERMPKDRSRNRPGYQTSKLRKIQRETRSFEMEQAQALWHADFHGGSLPVLLPSGRWVYPELFACLDDCSRACCHAQWYLVENAENVTHGFKQAIQKRGMPRSLMSDLGKAFMAREVTDGLKRLGILHEPTLPYSPNQNGKAEAWWRHIEEGLLAQLEGVKDLTLEFLNRATQVFIEMSYHQKVHSELGMSPLQRYREVEDLGRASPSSEDLRLAFTREVTRMQRRQDGTIKLLTQRFELPSRYRHLSKVAIRYAEWDLSHVYLADRKTGNILARIFPQDKAKNSDGRRRRQKPVGPDAGKALSIASENSGMAPLLTDLMNEFDSLGVPSAYLPRPEETGEEE